MDILDKLAKSKFRSRFKLRTKELEYINDKGMNKIYSHACDFIQDRVAPSEPANDGKQTPNISFIFACVILDFLYKKIISNIFHIRKSTFVFVYFNFIIF